MGFRTPWAYWLAGSQLQHLERMLLEPRTADRSPSIALAIVITENRIWRLLNLELWQRVCLDGEAIEDVVQP
jgi:hypothetical protein